MMMEEDMNVFVEDKSGTMTKEEFETLCTTVQAVTKDSGLPNLPIHIIIE